MSTSLVQMFAVAIVICHVHGSLAQPDDLSQASLLPQMYQALTHALHTVVGKQVKTKVCLNGFLHFGYRLERCFQCGLLHPLQ